jgi:hypothetical protein
MIEGWFQDSGGQCEGSPFAGPKHGRQMPGQVATVVQDTDDFKTWRFDPEDY